MSQAVATTSDFAPPVRACPNCGAECKRHSIYRRKVKDISLDGQVTLEIPVGNYRCATCRKFFKPEVPFAPKGTRYTVRATRKATVAVPEDKTTYCALPRRLDRDFSITPSKSSGWRWFQKFAGEIDIEDYLKWACSRFSGQISVDSVADGDRHTWFATDPLNCDLILRYSRCDSPNAESLTAFLTELRNEYGVNPVLFTGDDAKVFDSVPEQVWPGVRLQLCHFHVMKRASYHYLRHSLRARLLAVKPEKPKRGTLSAATYRARKEEHKAALERWTELHHKRRLFLKGLRSLTEPKAVERREAEFVAEACAAHPALATFREFLLDFYRLMDSKDAVPADLFRLELREKWAAEAKADEHIRHVVGLFWDDRWFRKVFNFTAFKNAHRTTNSTERANRWFRKRQKSRKRATTSCAGNTPSRRC